MMRDEGRVIAEQDIEITFNIEWKHEDPTGEKCVYCLGECHLMQHRLVISCGSRELKTEYFTCDDCMNEGEEF